jgi:hypothetical protein
MSQLDSTQTVSQLLQLVLPRPLPSLIHHPVEKFLSPYPPDETYPSFIPRPPPPNVLRQLLTISLPADNIQSICAPHIAGHIAKLPVSVLYEWKRVSEAEEQQRAWNLCSKWMETIGKLSDDHSRLSARVWESVLCLPYIGRLDRKFAGQEQSIKSVQILLGRQWLTDENIEQGFAILRLQMARDATRHSHIAIVPVYTFTLVVFQYEGQNEAKHKHIRQLEDDVRAGTYTKLLTVANVDSKQNFAQEGGNHWIAVVVDFTTGLVLIGNSLPSNAPSAQSRRHLLQWLETMDSAMRTQYQWNTWKFEALPITSQMDSDSCGIMALNAIQHHILPNHQLISSDLSGTSLYRLSMIGFIMGIDSDQVSLLI